MKSIPLLGVGLLLLMSLATPLQASVGTSPFGSEVTVTSGLWIPLNGQVQLGDDTVTLSGKIHVMVHVVIGSDPAAPVEVRVHINVAEGRGVGISGLTYGVVGAYGGTNRNPGYLLHILMDISVPVCHAPQGTPGYCGDDLHNWFVLLFTLTFDSDWHLVQATAIPCRDCSRTT